LEQPHSGFQLRAKYPIDRDLEIRYAAQRPLQALHDLARSTAADRRKTKIRHYVLFGIS